VQRELLSAEEVAEYLGLNPVTVYRWCREGRLPCLRIGKFWRVRREALEDFLQHSERPVAPRERLRPLLDVLPAHVAVVDESGTIVAVNEAWKRFAEANGGDLRQVGEGVNYLEVCDSAKGEQSKGATAFAEGLRSVLSSGREEFTLEYPCHSPDERRWFVGRVRRFPDNGTNLAMVSHESITDRKLLEERLEYREERPTEASDRT
jgi:excisionase family DNA binding protein